MIPSAATLYITHPEAPRPPFFTKAVNPEFLPLYHRYPSLSPSNRHLPNTALSLFYTPPRTPPLSHQPNATLYWALPPHEIAAFHQDHPTLTIPSHPTTFISHWYLQGPPPLSHYSPTNSFRLFFGPNPWHKELLP